MTDLHVRWVKISGSDIRHATFDTFDTCVAFWLLCERAIPGEIDPKTPDVSAACSECVNFILSEVLTAWRN